MNFLFFHSVKNLDDKTINRTPVPLHEALDYTNEGSEFLDDAIRMKDQPLVDTEEGVARMPGGIIVALSQTI